MRITALLSCLVLSSISFAQDSAIRLPRQPRISPDGETIAFVWQNDIWTASAGGGAATRLTIHPADDSRPFFAPDGEHLAFQSDRSGRSQIHITPVEGGVSRQLTFDSNSRTLLGFTGDGQGILVVETTNRGWARSEPRRLFVLDLESRADFAPKRMLFDAGFSDATLSPDGTRVLFTRGRAAWNRKGYRGAQALQLWLADLRESPPVLTRLDEDRPHFQNVSVMNPMWAPEGEGYYYVSDPDGTFDIYYRDLDGAHEQRVTEVGAEDGSDDGVAFASLSHDGSTILFRRRFDLHRLDLEGGALEKLALEASGDVVASADERRTEKSASSAAFTADGKQMAFVAGEDIFVMDRILKEPIRITDTPDRESSLCFNADGSRLFFLSATGGEVDIWEATHEEEEGIWWLAEGFTLRQITDDREVEQDLQLSPTGDHLAFFKGPDLFVLDLETMESRCIVELWSESSFDWSPDGKWLVYATEDADYNRDVWVVPIDRSREPFNISRHPDNDRRPRWSPDGTRIAFVSRRDLEESDIYYVNLTREEEEKTKRDERLEEALEAMKKSPDKKGDKKGGKKSGKKKGAEVPDDGKTAPSDPTPDPPSAGADDETDELEEAAEEEEEEEETVEVTIDFEDLGDRTHRISIPDSMESGLLWSPDGEKLAFAATIDGTRGFYTVEFPDPGKPKHLADSGLRGARWLEESNEIVGLSSGVGFPAALDGKGKVSSFGFNIRRVRDWRAVRRLSFDQGWRAMRDQFYDESMNNRDWEAVGAKYRAVAGQCLGAEEFSELMNMMLGELNASHMSHRGGSDPLPDSPAGGLWSPTTYRLGLRFELDGAGPGLVVESVIPGSPCDRERSRIETGERLLAIDGEAIGPDTDLDARLTLDELRDLELTVADREGVERAVTVRPVISLRGLLYDEWVEATRRTVEELSDGTLGYLHIYGMNMTSFRQMEEDLYHAGAGKDGLIIDVRFNGGGSTTDHVLTALTQPVHAITRSRGSGEGYPQDRKIYASWSKPVVLMCNEHSFSNAEILAHAVRQLGRGRVVGMRTAGGVISTGSVRLLDGSSVRMPARGWYLTSTGKDMELNGCEPDIALWNPPSGGDEQLEAAIQALQEDVATEQARGRVELEPAALKRQRRSTGQSTGK
jgi:tricorn protease